MKKIMLFLFFSTWLQVSIGQINWTKEFILNSTGSVSEIHFLNAEKNEKRIFNLSTENPYNNFHYSILRDNESDNRVYDMGDFLDKNGYFTTKDIPIKYVESITSLSKKSDLYTAISYNLLSYDNKGKVIGMKSTIIILDFTGEEIGKLEHIEVDARQPVVSNNGRYVMFQCGGALDINGYQIHPEGVRLYEICSENLLYEDLAKESESFYSPVNIKNVNMFRVSSKIRGKKEQAVKVFTIRIIDLDTSTLFLKSYTQNERNKLHAVEVDGLVFKNEGKLYKELFLSDFQKNKIKL